MYNRNNIIFFLHFGFLPSLHENAIQSLLGFNISEVDRLHFKEKVKEEEIINFGVRALPQSYIDIPEGDHIVPLSGGLDSRAVLGGLLEAGIKDRITTVTFGKAGNYDYEIAKKITKKFKIRHYEINLDQVKIDYESLLETAKNGGAWTPIFDTHYNYLIGKMFGKESTYWSGFVGGNLTATKIPMPEFESWEKAKDYFCNSFRMHKTRDLIPVGHQFAESLPDKPLYEKAIMDYDEQLYWAIRYQNYTKKTNLINGYNFKTPFFENDWVRFMLSLPRQYRLNQNIYRKVLLKLYPDLFAMPTTTNLGGALNISHTAYELRKHLFYFHNKIEKFPASKYLNPFWNTLKIYYKRNYIDFNEAIRVRKDYREIIGSNLNELKKREIIDWFDIDMILNDHLSQRRNLSFPLILLSALEMSLKVSE